MTAYIYDGLRSPFGRHAGALAPVLTDAMIAEMTCVGSLMMVGLGFNILGVTKLKISDMLPAIVLAPFVSLLFSALGLG